MDLKIDRAVIGALTLRALSNGIEFSLVVDTSLFTIYLRTNLPTTKTPLNELASKKSLNRVYPSLGWTPTTPLRRLLDNHRRIQCATGRRLEEIDSCEQILLAMERNLSKLKNLYCNFLEPQCAEFLPGTGIAILVKHVWEVSSYSSFMSAWKGRFALHYGGEVHRLVKSFSQDMVVWGKGWYAGEDEKCNEIFYSGWSSLEVKFLVRGFEAAQETWPPEISPSEKCPPRWHPWCHFLHPCTMFSTKGLLAVV